MHNKNVVHITGIALAQPKIFVTNIFKVETWILTYVHNMVCVFVVLFYFDMRKFLS